ncbi:MAG: hypothetical protein IKF97_01585 [Clostridia bacterium]|nr:hypothetical protein [Clostridia bacterium]
MKFSDIMSIDVSNFSMQQRFNLIKKAKKNRRVLKYLKLQMKNLSIEIGGGYQGNLFDLMNRGLLEGWCWQTTESAIVFLDDDAYIERGNLKFEIYEDIFFHQTFCKEYWHSWICFYLENTIWVFDPCLQIIVEKDIYYHIFEITEIAGKVTAKSVREELIYRIINYKPKFNYVSDRQKKETTINGNNDVSSPMYRNSTGYTATFNNGSINTLIAHYYYNG